MEKVKIFVTDGLTGLSEKISELFPDSDQQRCFIHLMRNIMIRVRVKDRSEVVDDYMNLSKQNSLDEALEKYPQFIRKWKKIYPSLKVWLN